MIKVKTKTRRAEDKYLGTDTFRVESGTLFVHNNNYGTTARAVYSAGNWEDAVVSQDPEPENLLDLDKLDSLLSPGEHVFVTYQESGELHRREKNKIDVYSHNNVTTETWRGHQIHLTNPLYEEEIVSRSRAYAAKVTEEAKQA